MKRFIAISFLFLFLTANTALGEILRLPTLLKHYIQHEEKENTSFFEFLKLHYADKINHPDDHQNHHKLPFKTMDFHSLQVISQDVPVLISFAQIITDSIVIKNAIRQQQFHSNSFLNNIWQPPRFS